MVFSDEDRKAVFNFFQSVLLYKDDPIYYEHLRGHVAKAPPIVKKYVRLECKGKELLKYFETRRKYFIIDHKFYISLKKKHFFSSNTYDIKQVNNMDNNRLQFVDNGELHIEYNSQTLELASIHTASSSKNKTKAKVENEYKEYKVDTLKYFEDLLQRKHKISLNMIDVDALPKKVKRYLTTFWKNKINLFFQDNPCIFLINDENYVCLHNNCPPIASKNTCKEDICITEGCKNNFNLHDQTLYTDSEVQNFENFFKCIEFFVKILSKSKSSIHVQKLSGYLSEKPIIYKYLKSNYENYKLFFLDAPMIFHMNEDEIWLSNDSKKLLKKARKMLRIKSNELTNMPVKDCVSLMFEFTSHSKTSGPEIPQMIHGQHNFKNLAISEKILLENSVISLNENDKDLLDFNDNSDVLKNELQTEKKYANYLNNKPTELFANEKLNSDLQYAKCESANSLHEKIVSISDSNKSIDKYSVSLESEIHEEAKVISTVPDSVMNFQVQKDVLEFLNLIKEEFQEKSMYEIQEQHLQCSEFKYRQRLDKSLSFHSIPHLALSIEHLLVNNSEGSVIQTETQRIFVELVFTAQMVCLEVLEAQFNFKLEHSVKAVTFFTDILNSLTTKACDIVSLKGKLGRAPSDVQCFMNRLYNRENFINFFENYEEFIVDSSSVIKLSPNYINYTSDLIELQKNFNKGRKIFGINYLFDINFFKYFVDIFECISVICLFLQNKQSVKLTRLQGIISKFSASQRDFMKWLKDASALENLENFLRMFRIFSVNNFVSINAKYDTSLLMHCVQKTVVELHAIDFRKLPKYVFILASIPFKDKNIVFYKNCEIKHNIIESVQHFLFGFEGSHFSEYLFYHDLPKILDHNILYNLLFRNLDSQYLMTFLEDNSLVQLGKKIIADQKVISKNGFLNLSGDNSNSENTSLKNEKEENHVSFKVDEPVIFSEYLVNNKNENNMSDGIEKANLESYICDTNSNNMNNNIKENDEEINIGKIFEANDKNEKRNIINKKNDESKENDIFKTMQNIFTNSSSKLSSSNFKENSEKDELPLEIENYKKDRYDDVSYSDNVLFFEENKLIYPNFQNLRYNKNVMDNLVPIINDKFDKKKQGKFHDFQLVKSPMFHSKISLINLDTIVEEKSEIQEDLSPTFYCISADYVDEIKSDHFSEKEQSLILPVEIENICGTDCLDIKLSKENSSKSSSKLKPNFKQSEILTEISTAGQIFSQTPNISSNTFLCNLKHDTLKSSCINKQEFDITTFNTFEKISEEVTEVYPDHNLFATESENIKISKTNIEEEKSKNTNDTYFFNDCNTDNDILLQNCNTSDMYHDHLSHQKEYSVFKTKFITASNDMKLDKSVSYENVPKYKNVTTTSIENCSHSNNSQDIDQNKDSQDIDKSDNILSGTCTSSYENIENNLKNSKILDGNDLQIKISKNTRASESLIYNCTVKDVLESHHSMLRDVSLDQQILVDAVNNQNSENSISFSNNNHENFHCYKTNGEFKYDIVPRSENINYSDSEYVKKVTVIKNKCSEELCEQPTTIEPNKQILNKTKQIVPDQTFKMPFLQPFSAKIVLLCTNSFIMESVINDKKVNIFSLKSSYHCDKHENCFTCYDLLIVGDKVLCYLPPDEKKYLGNMWFAFMVCKDDDCLNNSKETMNECNTSCKNYSNIQNNVSKAELFGNAIQGKNEKNVNSRKCQTVLKGAVKNSWPMSDVECQVKCQTLTSGTQTVNEFLSQDSQTYITGNIKSCFETESLLCQTLISGPIKKHVESENKYCQSDCITTCNTACQVKCSMSSLSTQTVTTFQVKGSQTDIKYFNTSSCECQTFISGPIKQNVRSCNKSSQSLIIQDSVHQMTQTSDGSVFADVSELDLKNTYNSDVLGCKSTNDIFCQTISTGSIFITKFHM